jgi:uncharacterized DUF497 family protein
MKPSGANTEKHALDFIDAVDLFDGRPIYTYPSVRLGEERSVTVGVIEEIMVALV